MTEFDYSKVKDPNYFEENRLEAHSDHAFFASGDEMKSGRNRLVYSLNGFWKFSYARNYQNAVKSADNCESWEDIRVPAHMQMEGYGVPQYANTQYPWDGRDEVSPGEIPEEFNPVGTYVKYFTLPSAMAGKRVFVSFQGAESGLAVWLNGHYVGYNEKENSYVFTDLLVDVIVYPDGFVRVVDLDELADAARDHKITEEQMQHALRRADKLLSVIYKGAFGKLQQYIEDAEARDSDDAIPT